MDTNQIRLCIIGFGNAALAFCNLINEKADEIKKNLGYQILITAISGGSKGSLINNQGIDIPSLIKSVEEIRKLSKDLNQLLDCSTEELIQQCDADVLLELSPSSIADGQPAIQYVEKAFEKGLHVITANKGPIAWDFNRLKQIAESRNRIFLYETSVMDGAPVFNLVRETLPGCKVISFKGILNSTTNFILEELEIGNTYNEAIKKAQDRGFAEADPSFDIDGWDSAAKTAAIANIILGGELTPKDIDRKGITVKQFYDAKKNNQKIKLICEGMIKNGKVVGRVHPVSVDRSDLFSNVNSTASILCVTTDLMGEICVIEKAPKIEQTAYGIYSDLLTLIRSISSSNFVRSH